MFPSSSLFAAVTGPFKRAQLGLYHGKMKQYGNSVPKSLHKTRRTWLPNVHNKRFFSDALQEFVRVKVTARAQKTIKKNGGLDNYLLKTKPELLGWEGMRLRLMVRDKRGELAAAITPEAATVVETKAAEVVA